MTKTLGSDLIHTGSTKITANIQYMYALKVDQCVSLLSRIDLKDIL